MTEIAYRRVAVGRIDHRSAGRPVPDADVRFFDTGHFTLETHCDEIAAAIRNFLSCST